MNQTADVHYMPREVLDSSPRPASQSDVQHAHPAAACMAKAFSRDDFLLVASIPLLQVSNNAAETLEAAGDPQSLGRLEPLSWICSLLPATRNILYLGEVRGWRQPARLCKQRASKGQLC